MLEKAIMGNRRYHGWLALVLAVAAAGISCWLRQWTSGSDATGQSRLVPWGLFVGNYSFLVGVAASMGMVVLPCSLVSPTQFGRVAVLGQFLAVATVAGAVLFILADLGRPERAFNLVLHPSPRSPFFWNMVLLGGYLLLNLILGWSALDAQRNSVPAPRWVQLLAGASVALALCIGILSSLVYSGVPGRPFWNSALLGPRFLASALAAGPALLIILCVVVRRISNFDPGREAIQKLTFIVCVAMIANILLVLIEVFGSFRGDAPNHAAAFRFLWLGVEGHRQMVPFTWTAAVAASGGVLILLTPRLRRRDGWLVAACALIFLAAWIDKGLALLAGGLAPTPFGTTADFSPTIQEIIIGVGIYAIGTLILTLLYRIALSVKGERETLKEPA